MSRKLRSSNQDDFGWPRVVPVIERPALPPLKTGNRVFCPQIYTNHCKQDDNQEYDKRLDSCKPAKFDKDNDDEDEVLMSRQKFMLLNESLTCKPVSTDQHKLKSTYQIGYVHDELTYEDIKNQLLVPIDEATIKQCRLKKEFLDPFPFTKINDKPPLLG